MNTSQEQTEPVAGQPRKKKRSKRKRSASSAAAGPTSGHSADDGSIAKNADVPAVETSQNAAPGQPAKRKRKRRRSTPATEVAVSEPKNEAKPEEPKRTKPKRRRRRSRSTPAESSGSVSPSQGPASAVAPQGKPVTAPETDKKGATQPKAKKTANSSDRPKTLSSQERLMLINVAEGEECRIAILRQNRLEELFIERASSESHVGNIYKGRVTNVEPSIQAAFVDFGLPKNGFLHISDIQPQYFPDRSAQPEEVGRKTPRRDRPPIQKCLRRGQEVIVQIIKEGIGTKGPTLTTYISIPGRYLVMMPGMNRLGVSRKIEDEDTRRKMRKVLEELELPKDVGFILRTAGINKTKRELQRDHLYLQRFWKRIAQKIKAQHAPCELYQESDLVTRTIRDVYSSDFSKIIVDEARTARKVEDFLGLAMPRSNAQVEVYKSPEPLFHAYEIEQEIERINARHVPLSSGGSLVIDSSEAMVTIDVNSGRCREHDDAEETAYRIDLEAAEEIARQLRLRDLGGLILCDFIDLHQEKHRRGVERTLREALKKHKERAKILRMSQFGIIEMTRQRMRPSIKRSIYQDCPHCHGSGLVKNPESMTLDIMRLLRLATYHDQVETVEVRVAPEVAFQLQNRKREAIHRLEKETTRRIVIRADSNIGLDQYAFECTDRRGGIIRVIDRPDHLSASMSSRPPRRPPTPDQTQAPHERGENVFE